MNEISLGFAASFVVLLAGAAFLTGQDTRQAAPRPDVGIAVQHLAAIQADQQPWGALRWMMNSRIDPQARQTFGVAELKAGQRNPRHFHPNCEELLYVISGSCEHIVGAAKVTLKAGDLIRIPRGVPHQAIVLGNEPFRSVVSYDSPDRQMVLQEP
jgi:quercetin dioxygenase-like cupin family protein